MFAKTTKKDTTKNKSSEFGDPLANETQSAFTTSTCALQDALFS